MKPGERQLWRVLNASALTYLNLEVVFNDSAQAVGVVALDGVPINENELSANHVLWQNHLGVPPGGRIEFIVKGPPAGTSANLVTRSVNTGWAGENDPNRPLATIIAKPDAPEPRSKLSESPSPLPQPTTAWLGNVAPARVRKLYFSETMQDPKDPNSPTTYYLTVDGQTPKDYSTRIRASARTSSPIWGMLRIGSSKTERRKCMHFTSTKFISCCWPGLACQ